MGTVEKTDHNDLAFLKSFLVFHQDNARPHTSARTVGTIRQLFLETATTSFLLSRSAPTDVHLFGSFNEILRVKRFALF